MSKYTKTRSGRGRPANKPALVLADAKRLKGALDALKITQAEAARRSGLSPSIINDVLVNTYDAKNVSPIRRRRALSANDLRALASAKDLRISADYVLGVPGAPMFVGEKLTGELAEALKAHVMTKALSRVAAEEWVREALAQALDGKAILAKVTELMEGELRQAGEHLRQMAYAAGYLRQNRNVPPELEELVKVQPRPEGGLVTLNQAAYQLLAKRILDREANAKSQSPSKGRKRNAKA